MNNLLEQIPGLAEAIERETFVRQTCFLDIPESICGIEVDSLTLAHVLLLESIGSPFICGGSVTPADVGAFFIVVTGRDRGLSRWLLLHKVGGLNAEQVVKEIEQYVAESFQDSPPKGGGNQTSYYSGAAALVDMFASQYGWSESRVLNTKLKCLFQYLKAAQKRMNPTAIMFNPSDKVKGQWLADVNAGRIQLNN